MNELKSIQTFECEDCDKLGDQCPGCAERAYERYYDRLVDADITWKELQYEKYGDF